MGTVQAAEQPDADADLFEPAFPHVGLKDFAQPCRVTDSGSTGNFAIRPASLWMGQSYEILRL